MIDSSKQYQVSGASLYILWQAAFEAGQQFGADAGHGPEVVMESRQHYIDEAWRHFMASVFVDTSVAEYVPAETSVDGRKKSPSDKASQVS